MATSVSVDVYELVLDVCKSALPDYYLERRGAGFLFGRRLVGGGVNSERVAWAFVYSVKRYVNTITTTLLTWSPSRCAPSSYYCKKVLRSSLPFSRRPAGTPRENFQALIPEDAHDNPSWRNFPPLSRTFYLPRRPNASHPQQARVTPTSPDFARYITRGR